MSWREQGSILPLNTIEPDILQLKNGSRPNPVRGGLDGTQGSANSQVSPSSPSGRRAECLNTFIASLRLLIALQ